MKNLHEGTEALLTTWKLRLHLRRALAWQLELNGSFIQPDQCLLDELDNFSCSPPLILRMEMLPTETYLLQETGNSA